MKNLRELTIPQATLLAALIAGLFGLVGIVINSFLNPETSGQPATPQGTEDPLCIKIKNDADNLALALDQKQKTLDDLDRKKIEYLVYRDAMSAYSNYSCDQINEEYNQMTKSMDEAKMLLNND